MSREGGERLAFSVQRDALGGATALTAWPLNAERYTLNARPAAPRGLRHSTDLSPTMTNPKLHTFRAMVAKNPDNALARFGLANEALKAGLWDEAIENLQAYLARYDDEGNGWGRLGEALAAVGRTDEARDALRTGIAASHRFGHPGMASELEARLEELDEG